MGYFQERRRIVDCVTRDGKIIELTPDNGNLKSNSQILEVYGDASQLVIKYPGYKTTQNKCDYCVYLVDGTVEHPVSHADIMYDLYDKTTMENYSQMKKYVETVARDGRNVDIPESLYRKIEHGFSFEKLTDLMVYIAIQEDINYPDERFQGRKMCFYRYLEAIYCKVNNNHKISEAVKKAEARGYRPSNWNDVGELYNAVSRIQR